MRISACTVAPHTLLTLDAIGYSAVPLEKGRRGLVAAPSALLLVMVIVEGERIPALCFHSVACSSTRRWTHTLARPVHRKAHKRAPPSQLADLGLSPYLV